MTCRAGGEKPDELDQAPRYRERDDGGGADRRTRSGRDRRAGQRGLRGPQSPPCTGPVPTVDEVVAVLAGLTDPDIPAANKTNIVTPGFSPDEAGTIDDHLTRMRVFGAAFCRSRSM